MSTSTEFEASSDMENVPTSVARHDDDMNFSPYARPPGRPLLEVSPEGSQKYDGNFEEEDRDCYDHFATNWVDTAKWALIPPWRLNLSDQKKQTLSKVLTLPREGTVAQIHERLENPQQQQQRVLTLLRFFQQIAGMMRHFTLIVNQYGKGMRLDSHEQAIEFILIFDLAVPALEDFMRIFTERDDVAHQPVFEY